MLERWKARAQDIRRDVTALYLARRDPRVPRYARLLAIAIVGYALSPIDLIPDFIPVLGYLDDLIIVPLGLLLLVRMIPPQVLDEYRMRAEQSDYVVAKNKTAAVLIVALWCCGIAVAWFAVRRHLWRGLSTSAKEAGGDLVVGLSRISFGDTHLRSAA
ncbi:YkvA family protein [Occallatibacter savannae]|uniref:YkvA family protein n=1 Tax=Occallatibacter savannae TaxID=1002691 RepID=UPI000D689ADC|nr:YkvA family protein [Occallatibacter savannae]